MKIILDETEKHIQVNDFHAQDEENYRSFWRDLQAKYTGYEIDFCYHNAEVPVAFMKEIGAILLESCVEMRLVKVEFAPVYKVETIPVTNENFDLFTVLHDKINPNMYWTSQRVRRDLCQWCIFVCNDAYVMMSLWGNDAEVFALESSSTDSEAALLSAAAAFAFKAGKTSVVMMVDDNAPGQADTARSVGFAECGTYIAYRGTV